MAERVLTMRVFSSALCVLLVSTSVLCQSAARAEPTIPPVWDILADDFEGGTLDAWRTTSEGDLSLVPGDGHLGSTGLSVAVGQDGSYIYQTRVARADGRRDVFISGTSAIRGHQTIAPGQIVPQLDCTVENIEIIAEACGIGRDAAARRCEQRFVKTFRVSAVLVESACDHHVEEVASWFVGHDAVLFGGEAAIYSGQAFEGKSRG